jgi:hypothetical protein
MEICITVCTARYPGNILSSFECSSVRLWVFRCFRIRHVKTNCLRDLQIRRLEVNVGTEKVKLVWGLGVGGNKWISLRSIAGNLGNAACYKTSEILTDNVFVALALVHYNFTFLNIGLWCSLSIQVKFRPACVGDWNGTYAYLRTNDFDPQAI